MYNSFLKYIIYSTGLMAFKKIMISNNTQDKKHTNMEVPSFRGVLEVRHIISGRVRFYVPSLKDDLELASFVKEKFKALQGIYSIEINTITASVVVNYKESVIKPVLIEGILIKLLRLEDKISKKSESLLTKEMKTIDESINQAMYEKTAGIVDTKSLIFIALLFMGIKKVLTNTENKHTGLTYIWWAYSILK